MIHQLKILPKFFEKVISGEKTFEVRLNDREYEKGDMLALNEWEQTSSSDGRYTGRSCLVDVDYILHGTEGVAGIDEDCVVMAIKPCVVYKVTESYYADGSKHNVNEVPIILDKESGNESV